MNSTFKYLTKNFFYLASLAIIPAALVTLFCDPLRPLVFFRQLFLDPANIHIENFYTDIYSYFSSVNMQHLIFWILSVFLIAVGVGIICCAIERHLRLGIKSYSKIWSMINNSVLFVLPIVLIAIVFYELLVIIYSGLVLLFSLFLTGYAFISVCIVAYALMITLIILAMTYTLCTIPIMINDGYKLNIACSYSGSIMSKKVTSTFFSLAGVVFGYIILMCLAKIFLAFIVFLFLKAILSGLLLLYVSASSILTYTTLTNGPREDTQKGIFKN